jgi:hypothetical protein
MAKYHQRPEKNNQVHGNVERLRSKEKSSAVDTPGAGVFWIPVCLKGHTAHQGSDLHGEVARNDNSYDAEAQLLFPRERCDARVLEHDGHLEEEMRQAVELHDADLVLLRGFWGKRLWFEGGQMGSYVPLELRRAAQESRPQCAAQRPRERLKRSKPKLTVEELVAPTGPYEDGHGDGTG